MLPPDETLQRLLTDARTIAVVGLSDKPERDSNEVARYLQGQGYRVVPVNPAVSEVLGERSYRDLSAIPPAIRIDLVDIFRRSDQVPPIVAEALVRHVPAIWMQLGVEHEEAAARARATGAVVVENACLRIEHQRLGIPPRSPG